MDTDAGAPGDLEEYRQQALKARTLRHLYLIYECGDEVVGILEGVADKVTAFDEFIEALVVVVRGAVERAGDGLRIVIRRRGRRIGDGSISRIQFGRNRRRNIADQLVIHKIKNYSVGNALKNERKWDDFARRVSAASRTRFSG